MSARTCDACGGEAIAARSIGGTILCRKCAPLVEAEIDLLRAAGKSVSAPKIAATMRRGNTHAYILRDIPPALWEQVLADAARHNQTAREWIMGAIEDKLRAD